MIGPRCRRPCGPVAALTSAISECRPDLGRWCHPRTRGPVSRLERDRVIARCLFVALVWRQHSTTIDWSRVRVTVNGVEIKGFAPGELVNTWIGP